jgi:hypothetical protein
VQAVRDSSSGGIVVPLSNGTAGTAVTVAGTFLL